MGSWYEDLIIILNNHRSNDSCSERHSDTETPRCQGQKQEAGRQ